MAKQTNQLGPEKLLTRIDWWFFVGANLFAFAVIMFFPFLRIWWWIICPLILSTQLEVLYFWFLRWDHNYANKKWVMLELIPPKELLTPLKAMEDVYTILWPTLNGPPNFREKWCEGILEEGADWLSFEIVSIEGKIHFYLRLVDSMRKSIEAALYAHYPQLEIKVVPDYTKNIPTNLPNEEWDIYGEDFITAKKAPYPIKTYEKFFEPQGEKISAEEKRIDPMASLLEQMAALGPGEQFWLQFILTTFDDETEKEIKKEADRIIGKIVKRPEKKSKTIKDELRAVLSAIIFGPVKVGEGEKATYKLVKPEKTETGEREMVLTPGEREIVTEVENKMRKPMFRTFIRGFYVARRANFKAANKVLTRSYFAHFHTQNMNYIKFSGKTRPKTKYFFRKSIPASRSKRMFRNYITRFTPLFPDRKKECAFLNTEELTTLFHFPFKITGMAIPTTESVQSKKSGPPSNLPM